MKVALMGPNPTAPLATDRLALTPLQPTDAEDMVRVLADIELYRFTGGKPPSIDDLKVRYKGQVAGPSNSNEVWHNWIIRLIETGEAVGFVQATVSGSSAEVAWVVGVDWQGKRIATEAAHAMCEWLDSQGIENLTAHIHPQHQASTKVADAIGLRPTNELDDEGEVVWRFPNPRRQEKSGTPDSK
ncbi:MAG TPA: GNAT family N-acetyltransferase [Acidimicrobiia bacterium]|nr:GNAT family N-acetyltransferase [Acidimicrobiia bacterium]